MSPLSVVEGLACPLPLINVDTDQLIPARFMKTPRSQGYGDFLLYDLRRNEQGSLLPHWPINSQEGSQAKVLVARKNFGAGSSREAAVYALFDAGFRCVVAPSFGDIFASNAVNNGLLPALVDEYLVEQMLSDLSLNCLPCIVNLELENLSCGGQTYTFDIKPTWKTKLINGWDDIALTMSLGKDIQSFRAHRSKTVPWLFPSMGA